MDQKRQEGKPSNLTRRDFIRDGAIAAAGLAVGASGSQIARAGEAGAVVRKTRSYNPEMEYRRLGKTGLWVSAACLGGHWKRIDMMVPGVFKGSGWLSADLDSDGFKKNRRDVVTRCIESGINYIDACTWEECVAYAEALRGRRDAMFLGFSWYQEEMRNGNFRTVKALLGTLDKGMSKAKLDYVDLWRITMHEQSGNHTNAEVDEMIGALEKARQQGKVRFCGASTHDRPHIKWMIETYPTVFQVVVTPYTAKSKVRPKDSVFDAVKKHDMGVFGIKPFAGTSLFKGDSSPNSPEAEADDQLARLAIRYILATDAITAPIPGMINKHQVDNVVKAIKERRELDVAEAKELEQAMDEAWANLPPHRQWLKDWEYV
ncbi:MAG TPA: aldo/keto reductase [Sedimentisphaerales bacterium]|nr:aldo/keto reductase [Sedimentisphaerales bacterium]